MSTALEIVLALGVALLLALTSVVSVGIEMLKEGECQADPEPEDHPSTAHSVRDPHFG